MANLASKVLIEELKRLYYDEGLSGSKIAELFGVTPSAVYGWLGRAGCPRRTNREAQLLEYAKGFKHPRLREDIDTVELKDLYLGKKLSSPQIAKKFNCSEQTVRRRLRAIGCTIRNPSETTKLSCTTRRHDLSDDTIKGLYLEGKLSAVAVATRLNCPVATINGRLKRMGIRRGRSEAMRLAFSLEGRHSPNYKGGRLTKRSGYVYAWAPGYPGTNGGYALEHRLVWEHYHKKQLPKGYVVHHLNGIKNDNRPENLAALKAGEHTNQTEPYKKRIRQLEIENRQLRHALEDSQMIFCIGEN